MFSDGRGGRRGLRQGVGSNAWGRLGFTKPREKLVAWEKRLGGEEGVTWEFKERLNSKEIGDPSAGMDLGQIKKNISKVSTPALYRPGGVVDYFTFRGTSMKSQDAARLIIHPAEVGWAVRLLSKFLSGAPSGSSLLDCQQT